MADAAVATLPPVKAEGSHSSPSSEAGPSQPLAKYRFQPRRHLEPPQPPPTDHKVEEEAAAQAAAIAAGYEGRKMRRFLQRRTVDYMGSWIRYKEQRLGARTYRDDYWLKPSPHHAIDLQPAAAARTPASSAAPHLVHTSTNKIRTPVNCVSWLPSSRRLLTGSSSGEFTLWNGLTFNFETILQACDHGVRNLEWSSSGNLLISGDGGGTVKYFLPNMNNVLAVDAHRESVRGLSFSPDDARWVSGSDDSTIKMFNTERGVEETTMKGHGWDVKCLQWHPFKGLIASGGKDNLVKFWDPRRGGREIGTFHGHKNTVQSLAFSPTHVSSSELLATASRDQTVKLYDLRMIKEYMTLRAAPVEGGNAEASGVCSLAWHPFAQLLSSGLANGVLQHHSLAPSAAPDLPICTVPQAHDQSIWAMSWHPLGHVLATGANDCYTRWWQRERLEEGDFTQLGENAESGEAGASAQSRGLGATGGSRPVGSGYGSSNPRRGGAAWGDDEDDGASQADTSMSFIPGLGMGGARAGVGGPPFGNGNGQGQTQRRDRDRDPMGRAPPPPEFGFGVEAEEASSAFGARGVGGGGGGPARDSGWGRPPPPPPSGLPGNSAYGQGAPMHMNGMDGHGGDFGAGSAPGTGWGPAFGQDQSGSGQDFALPGLGGGAGGAMPPGFPGQPPPGPPGAGWGYQQPPQQQQQQQQQGAYGIGGYGGGNGGYGRGGANGGGMGGGRY